MFCSYVAKLIVILVTVVIKSNVIYLKVHLRKKQREVHFLVHAVHLLSSLIGCDNLRHLSS